MAVRLCLGGNDGALGSIGTEWSYSENKKALNVYFHFRLLKQKKFL